MDLKKINFNSKEELAEWLVLNIEDRFDQEELMFEGLMYYHEEGRYYIKSRIIHLKLKKTVQDETGETLYLEDYKKPKSVGLSETSVTYKKTATKPGSSYIMPLWKWIKLQSPPEKLYDPEDDLPF